MIQTPAFLSPLFDALIKKGAHPILVGGFVRDSILGYNSKDIDIEVYAIESYKAMAEVLAPFGLLNFVGKSFGILKLRYLDYQLDFSLPRQETKIASGHKGFRVKLDAKLSYKEAAKRRDFTINSIGFDPLTQTILDPFGGMKDIENKQLCYVDKNSFVEDPLRVLRAVQFCARFDLTCKDELIELCQSLCDGGFIDELPKERIFEEIRKLFLQSSTPSKGLKLFYDFHLISLFSELLHVRTDFKYIDSMSQLKTHENKRDLILFLGVLIFDFTSIEEVNSFLQKLLDDKHIIEELHSLYHHKDSLEHIVDKGCTRYDIALLSTKVILENLLLIHQAREQSFRLIRDIATALHVLTCKPKPLLQGRDLIALGFTPSKRFSEILDLAYDTQLREIFTTYDEAKVWLQNNIIIFNR